MITERRVVTLLQAFLVVLFAILVVFQTLSLPGQFAYDAKQHPDRADERWVLTGIAVVLILCVQVVIVSTWKLLNLVKADRIFSEVAFVWVNAIIRAIASAWLVIVGCLLYVGIHADDPGAPMVLLLLSIGVAVI